MCGAAKLGWRVSIDRNAAADKPIFIFDVQERVDRSVNQSDRNRVIFSVQQHNVGSMTREVGITAAKNALYLDIDGTVQSYPRAEDGSGREVAVGYNRREEYCALSGKSLDPEVYRVEAEQNMADRMTETDSLTIEAGNPLDYGVLYDVGTIVTVYDKNRSLQLDSVISAATVKRSGTEYTVKLTLGESKPKLLDQYQKKNDSTQKTVKNEIPKLKKYISAKVANSQAIAYDSIERGVLSVDFNVDGTDSDVVFAGNQLCNTTAAGTLDCIYKVDGAAQDFKPSRLLTAGKHIVPHFYPMPLNIGKHNFAVYVLSSDGGRGVTGISELVGALSGQISGLKSNAPPNENLVLYFADVPAGTEISLPSRMYSSPESLRIIDWGDGSAVEESKDSAIAAHNYAEAGSYTVTVKCNDTVFYRSGTYVPDFSGNFSAYITRIYFPDSASEIGWGKSTLNYSSPTRNFANLETLVFGKSAASINWNFKNSPKITSLLIPESVQKLYLDNFKNTSVSSFIVPWNVIDYRDNGSSRFRENPSLTSLELYSSISFAVWDCPNLKRLVVGENTTVDVRDCPNLEYYETSANPEFPEK